MARPRPNNSEKSANAFKDTNSSRKTSTARSSGDVVLLEGKNCSKIETRNSNTMLMAMTPKSARPRRISNAASRSAGARGAEDGFGIECPYGFLASLIPHRPSPSNQTYQGGQLRKLQASFGSRACLTSDFGH